MRRGKGKKRASVTSTLERLEARQLLSAAIQTAAITPGLTDAVYHGDRAYPAGQVPNPNPNTSLTDGVLGGDNAALARTVAYAASHTPNYTFVNSNDAFVYAGGSGALTENFLNNGTAPTPGGTPGYGPGAVGDAAGAALTDPANVNDTIFDAEGYFLTPTANDGGPFFVQIPIGNVDDLIAVYMGGNGTPGSGTLVASAGWQGANAGTPNFQFNVKSAPDLTQPSAIPIEILYGNGFGGANTAPVGGTPSTAVLITDQNNAQVTAYQTTATNEPLPDTSTLSGQPFNNLVSLSWTAVNYAQTYSVWRYLDGQPASTAVRLATGLSTLTYTDHTAQNNTTYDYYITADNGSGSTPSNTIVETPMSVVTGPVQFLTAARTDANTVKLSFTAPPFGTNYTITRSTSLGGTQTTLTPPGGQTATTFADTNAPTTGGTNYFYTVTSVDSAGSSTPVTVFVGQGDGFAGDYYSSSQADPNGDGLEKPLTGDASNAVLGFERVDPTIAVPVTNAPPGWNAIQPNTSNDFAVRWTGYVEAPLTGYYTLSVNNVDDREQIFVFDPNHLTGGNPTPVNISPAGHVMTGFGDTYNATVVDTTGQPYQFTAGQQYLVQVDFNQGSGGLNANLSWAASSTTANQTAGTYDLMTPQAVPTYDANAPTPAFSTVDASGTVTKDQGYYTFTAVGGNATVNMSWDNVPADSYNLYRATSANGPYTKVNTAPIAATKGTAVSYSDTTVTNGTTYFYILTGVDVNGETAINLSTGTTAGLKASAMPQGNPPATPTGVVVVGTDGKPGTTFAGVQGHVSLPAVQFASSYIIQRAPESSPGSGTPGTFATVPGGGAVTGSGSTITFTDTDPALTATGNYFYRVIAVNSAGQSTPSTPVEMKAVGPALASEGTVEVDVQASGYGAGTTGTVVNVGNAGGLFNAVGAAITVGSNADAGNTAYQSFQFSGNSASSTFNSPTDLNGNSSRSVELWVNNPTIDGIEESMVSWARRGGNPDGSNMSFSVGSQYGVGLWGGEYDIQWTANASGAPTANHWHYMVFTYDGSNENVYLDGNLYISQPVPTGNGGNGQLNTVAGFPVNLAAQNASNTPGAYVPAILGSVNLAAVRIEGGALTQADITNNFNAGVPGQPAAPAQTPVTVTLTGTGPNPSNATQPLSFTASVSGGVPDGETVTLQDSSNGNKVVASGTLSGGSATLNVPAGTLLAGTHNLVAAYGGDATFASGKSTALAQVVQVVVTGVVVNGNNAALAGVQRSMVSSIVYTFSEPVNVAATNAFSIAVHAGQTGTAPSLAWAAINPGTDGSSAQWVVTFSGTGVTGGSIGDGVYDITLNAAAATSDANSSVASQSRPTDTFYRLYGDITGDGRVNNADYNQFLNAFNTKPGQTGYNAGFDASGTGSRINNADYNLFLNNYNKRFTGFTATI